MTDTISYSKSESHRQDKFGCPLLNNRINYLKVGDYLLWHDENGYYVYFRTSEHGENIKAKNSCVVCVPLTEDVYMGMRGIEGKIIYSDRKFRCNTSKLSDFVDEDGSGDFLAVRRKHLVAKHQSATRKLASAGCPMPGADDGYADLSSVIRNMDKIDRDIVSMRADGYLVAEIAKELSTSVATIERRIAVIKKTIKLQMGA